MTDRATVRRRRILIAIAFVALTVTTHDAGGAELPTTTSLPEITSTTTTTSTSTSTSSTSTTSTTSTSTTSTTLEEESSFGILANTLGITVPSSADFGSQSSASGTVFSAQLGTVTVDDTRTGILRSWTATVSSSSFTTGAGGAGETISTASIKYWSGPATAKSGTIVAVPGQTTALTAVTLSSTGTAFSSSGGTDTTSVSWNPTIVVTVPTGVSGGTYSGTITHSVA